MFACFAMRRDKDFKRQASRRATKQVPLNIHARKHKHQVIEYLINLFAIPPASQPMPVSNEIGLSLDYNRLAK